MPPERPQIPDYYEVLGIGFNAAHDEVRVAWREAVKRWHPDLNRGDPSAAERMREVNEAWEVLGKPESRAAYNRNYFILQAAIAEAEREQHEQERLRAERQEEIRRREAERLRREEAAARRRQEEAERRRRETKPELASYVSPDSRAGPANRRRFGTMLIIGVTVAICVGIGSVVLASLSTQPTVDQGTSWLPWPDAAAIAKPSILVDHPDCINLDHQVPFPSMSVAINTGEIGLRVHAEVMQTGSEREQGSMCRTELSQGVGFLYELGRDVTYAFWSFNSYVPMDIAYLNVDRRVVGTATMVPCPRPLGATYMDWVQKCQTESRRYLPDEPYRWALELRAGWIQDVTGLPLADALANATFDW